MTRLFSALHVAVDFGICHGNLWFNLFLDSTSMQTPCKHRLSTVLNHSWSTGLLTIAIIFNYRVNNQYMNAYLFALVVYYFPKFLQLFAFSKIFANKSYLTCLWPIFSAHHVVCAL